MGEVQVSYAIFVDFPKTFGGVPHDALLYRLRSCGFQSRAGNSSQRSNRSKINSEWKERFLKCSVSYHGDATRLGTEVSSLI